MDKLKTIIQYECSTKLKAIWIFYIIQYSLIALISAIIAISISDGEVGTNCVEINTVIFVGVVGVLGFKEDFKMLIQHGFVRKYILFGTFSMFLCISGVMALIDTIVGTVLHYITNDYSSVFGSIYGYNNIFANWIWLLLLYTLVCSVLYLAVLVINRIGKTASIYLGIVLGGLVLLLISLCRYVLPQKTISHVLELAARAMGFMNNGTINYIFPVVSFAVLIAVLGMGCYAVIRRTELK